MLLAFAMASLVTVAVPGPAVVYVVTRSLEHGRSAGLYSMAGLETGAAVHVSLAAGGLAAVLRGSPVAITLIAWLGAAYLLWLAVQALRSARTEHASPASTTAPLRRRLYWDGLLVDLLNPKTALFFLAFLPQFVDPTRGSVPAQMALLGAIFVLIAAMCDTIYAVLAGQLAGRLRCSPRAQRRVGLATAGVYAALAAAAIAL